MHCRTNESAVGIKASVARQPVLYKVIAFPEMLHAVKNIFRKMSNWPGPRHYSVSRVVKQLNQKQMEKRINACSKGQNALKALYRLGIYWQIRRLNDHF